MVSLVANSLATTNTCRLETYPRIRRAICRALAEQRNDRLSYGELAHEAAVLSPPREPALRAVAGERTRSMLPA